MSFFRGRPDGFDRAVVLQAVQDAFFLDGLLLGGGVLGEHRADLDLLGRLRGGDALDRGEVDVAVAVAGDAPDLVQGGIVQHPHLAVADLVEDAAVAAAGQDGVVAGDVQADDMRILGHEQVLHRARLGDAVDGAGVAQGADDVALLVLGEVPDEFLVGVEQFAGLVVLADAEHPAVGRRPGDHVAVGGDQQRVHVQLLALEDPLALARGADLVDRGVVAGAQVEVAVGGGGGGQVEFLGGAGDGLQLGAQEQLAVAVDADIDEAAFLEVGQARFFDLPDLHRPQRGGQGQEGHEDKRFAIHFSSL